MNVIHNLDDLSSVGSLSKVLDRSWDGLQLWLRRLPFISSPQRLAWSLGHRKWVKGLRVNALFVLLKCSCHSNETLTKSKPLYAVISSGSFLLSPITILRNLGMAWCWCEYMESSIPANLTYLAFYIILSRFSHFCTIDLQVSAFDPEISLGRH
ncbi:hypothetical protein BGZ60DRAFT_282584 [Tricladium varicosporioides]|nr:hypothetical protein BGZ60DRAFT_282584 [Hymenoscyphus varicosporioides]